MKLGGKCSSPKPVDNKPKPKPDKLKHAEQFVAGFIHGVLQKDDLNEIEQCLADAHEVVDEFEKAIKLLEKKNPEDIIQGIKIIVKAVEELPNYVKECSSGLKDNVDRIHKWLSVFKDSKWVALI